MLCEPAHKYYEDVHTSAFHEDLSVKTPTIPASFEAFRAEINKENLPPPYTLPYTLPEESVLESHEKPDSVAAMKCEQHEDKIESDFVHNKGKKSGNDLLETQFEESIDTFPSHCSQDEFYQEEYNTDEVSLDELDNHYADVAANYSDVHAAFSEEAHASIFPPHSKDLFVGKNEQVEEIEYQIVDWKAFVEYCIAHDFPEEYMPYIRLSSAKIHGDECILRISSGTALHQLNTVQKEVEKFLVTFLGKTVKIRYAADAYERRTLVEMMEAMHEHPQIKMLQKEFGANLLRCSCLKTEYKDK